MFQHLNKKNKMLGNKGLNKRAVSEVVAYVLLIVISLSIAGMIYAWLRFYVPGQEQKCPDNVAIVIKEHLCTIEKNINITLQNKGLFNLSGFYIYISNETGALPILEPTFKSSSRPLSNSERGYILFESPLLPGEEFDMVLSYSMNNRIEEIEIEPFRWQDKKVVLCRDAIIREKMQGCG